MNTEAMSTQAMVDHAFATAKGLDLVIMQTQVEIDDLDAELAMIESSRRFCWGELKANNLQALAWSFQDKGVWI